MEIIIKSNIFLFKFENFINNNFLLNNVRNEKKISRCQRLDSNQDIPINSLTLCRMSYLFSLGFLDFDILENIKNEKFFSVFLLNFI